MADDEGTPPVSGEPDGQSVALTAQWALWGKGAEERTYGVLASSAEDLTAWDFVGVVERYSAGTADRLPQYTVFWVPDAEDAPEFVGIAIHEHASYAQHDARRHTDASGREIVYSRLFCVRYADLAEHGVTFTELLGAVQHQQLPPGYPSAPVAVHVASQQPPHPPQSPADTGPELAEVVAGLLLTTKQVCILGAEEVSAAERLAFIDQVLSLLPYGLRATLSAATWVSPTALDLKLRLFFASARRDDSNRTHHVRWGQHGRSDNPALDSDVVRRYLGWLQDTRARAKVLLAGQTAPIRLSHADISAMVAALPGNLTVTDILDDLADSLREGDAVAAGREALRLEQHLADPVNPAYHARYRDQIVRQGLLGNHPELRQDGKARIYRTLLRLAFDIPLSYRSYCAIEDAIGGPPRGTLRLVLLDLGFDSYVPWLLAAKGERRMQDEELMTTLTGKGTKAALPLTEVQRELADIRPAHQPAAYDFAMRYLRTHAEDPKAELAQRGYLAETLAAAFPDDPAAQRIRLEDSLLFVHGASLSRGQIRDLFSEPDLRPTAAFEAAVTRLAASPKAHPLIAELAAETRARNVANGDKHAPDSADSRRGRHPSPWRTLFSRHRDAAPSDPVRLFCELAIRPRCSREGGGSLCALRGRR